MSNSELVAVFSEEWAIACARILNGQDGYRVAAATWEATIVLTMTAIEVDGSERRVLLDLYRGECRLARAAGPTDEDGANYVLSGTAEAWRQVLSGTLAPLFAIMSGKLRITKGGLMDLMPYVGAARELVAAASIVPARFPDGS